MKGVDEILAAIDSGLQHAGDAAYGCDRPGACWRCRRIVGVDLCDTCRTELLDETRPPAGDVITILINLGVDEFIAAIDRLVALGEARYSTRPNRSAT